MAESILNGVLAATRPTNVPKPEIAGIPTSAGLTNTALYSDIRATKQGDYIAVPPSDWESFDPALFTYIDSLNVGVAELNPFDYFQLGDKIRYQQGGVVKYAYVTYRTSTTLGLYSGNSASVANVPIETFAISRLPSALGHPGVFVDNTIAIRRGSNNVEITGWTQNLIYTSINAGIGTIHCSLLHAAFPASEPSINFDLPFRIEDNSNRYRQFSGFMSVGSVTTGGYNIEWSGNPSGSIGDPWSASIRPRGLTGNFTSGGVGFENCYFVLNL